MTLKLTLPVVAMAGGLAAFVAYLVAGDFAAASWAAIAALLAAVLTWDLWKNHRVESTGSRPLL